MPLFPKLMLAAAGALLMQGLVGGESAEERAKVIAGFESNLLTLLGFSKRPRPPRVRAHVPEALEQLYRRQGATGVVDVAKRGINAGSANTVRSFVHIESEIDEKFKSMHSFRLSFDVSRVPVTERLHAAELSLSRKSFRSHFKEDDGVPKIVKLMVHDIVRPGVKGKSKPILRLVDTKAIDIRSNSTISLDVRPAVERWLSNDPGQSGNHGLLVKVVGEATNPTSPHHQVAHVRLRRNPDEQDEIWQRIQPTLYTYTDDGRKKASTASDIMERRTGRAALRKSRRKGGQESCRRHPFYVDFAEIGWDEWIVAPPGYEMYYCHGECPFPMADHLNATKHAIVQNIVHSVNPDVVSAVCCVPTSLGAISILYFDENNEVVLKNYQDMSVLECGCR